MEIYDGQCIKCPYCQELITEENAQIMEIYNCPICEKAHTSEKECDECCQVEDDDEELI